MAVLPGLPIPSLTLNPSGPTTENPRVLRTSIGKRTVELIFSSWSNVRNKSTNEFSSPNASAGIVTAKSMSSGVLGTKVGLIF